MPSAIPEGGLISPPSLAQNSQTAKQEKKSGFSFGDFIDVINPLQHIPVVNTVYRRVIGDEISDTAKLIGGSLFGGAIGLAAAGASVLVEKVTGSDIGEHLINPFWEKPENPNAKVYIESKATPESASPLKTQVEAQGQLPPQKAVEKSNALKSNPIPTLSPAAMEALLSSVPMLTPQSQTDEDSEKQEKTSEGPTQHISQAQLMAALLAAQEQSAKSLGP